ncbi:carbamoyltransferase [Roseivirga sp. BDSF3-8]|uniref:carbamoyltransferase family protein n=1 Tax=Roseivirga sp. BDSF3-8 TaxID=3241598 RepID=UPI0035323E5E
MNIIGISALYHDSACCILQNGKLTAAAQEERFTRQKNDSSMPLHAFRYCLEEAGLTLNDIDRLAYYEDPVMKLARQIWSGHDPLAPHLQEKLDPRRAEREIRELLGYEGPVDFHQHHESHAASTFFFSGFDSAAIMTFDGVGEWASTTYGTGKGSIIELFEEVHFPDSIGLLYSTITSYLGFKVNNGEYKVMGLAPYGKPVYRQQIEELFEWRKDGQFRLNMKYFDFIGGERMYSDELVDLFGMQPRVRESKMDQNHMDVARSLQVVLEELLLEKAAYLHEKTGEENLCMAGGVALNCVANGRILREGPFKKLFVQPASNDSGCALGAAALSHMKYSEDKKIAPMPHAYYGPAFSDAEIRRMLEATDLKWSGFEGNEDELIDATAQKIADGNVVGWFQGKMEFGPRALGCRSILGDPRDPGMRDKINLMVKKREGFRPFAPAVLLSEAQNHFKLDHPSPFMLETCQVDSPLDLPAITHVDNSARVQTVTEETNPLFAALLTEFNNKTGSPIILNTSFNVRGEPIVCTPVDALECFILTEIDCLVVGSFMISRKDNDLTFLEDTLKEVRTSNRSAISTDVYTFI